MPGCCTTDQTFLEYTGAKFVSRTQVRGAFTRYFPLDRYTAVSLFPEKPAAAPANGTP